MRLRRALSPALLAALVLACRGDFSAVLAIDVSGDAAEWARMITVTVEAPGRDPRVLTFERPDGQAFRLSPPRRVEVTFRELPGADVALAVSVTTDRGATLRGCGRATLAQGKRAEATVRVSAAAAGCAGARDGGVADGPTPDAAPPDAAGPDAAPPDAPAPDGPPECAPACTNEHGATRCVAGVCRPSCAAGFGDCDYTPWNGCETSLRTLESCNACGVQCAREHAAASCAAGTCELGACTQGFGNCDGNAANGCETALDALETCGACDNTCRNPNGTTSCRMGMCAPVCATGFADCDGDPSNGCETSTRTLTDCGGCRVPCDVMGGGESCATGTCQPSGCPQGTDDCDGVPGGCETPLGTVSNCGACGVTCTNPNGTTACSAGACQPSCNAGYGNCDGNPRNGCEQPLDSLQHCGGCGQPCALAGATESCASRACRLEACESGFANCDTREQTGCEVVLAEPTNTAPGEAVGTLDADSNAGTLCPAAECSLQGSLARVGRGSRYLQYTARESSLNLCGGRIALRFELTSPAGADYDLYVSGGCACMNTTSSSCSSQTGVDVVTVWCDKTGQEDAFTAQVEVRFSSGSSCDAWTLAVRAGGC